VKALLAGAPPTQPATWPDKQQLLMVARPLVQFQSGCQDGPGFRAAGPIYRHGQRPAGPGGSGSRPEMYCAITLARKLLGAPVKLRGGSLAHLLRTRALLPWGSRPSPEPSVSEILEMPYRDLETPANKNGPRQLVSAKRIRHLGRRLQHRGHHP
jgi:hypothetical protein